MDRESFLEAVSKDRTDIKKQISLNKKELANNHSSRYMTSLSNNFHRSFNMIKWRKIDADFSQIPPLL